MAALLRRQLAKLGITEGAPPNLEQWQAFLALVRRTYVEANQDRYTLERSLMMSSREMQEVYGKLRTSEANFRLVAEGIPDAVFVHQHGIIRYANPSTKKMLGLADLDGIVGRDCITSFVHPDDQTIARAVVECGDGSEESVAVLQLRWLRADGTTILVESRRTPIVFDDQPAVLVIARDVTAAVRAEQERDAMATAIRVNEQRFRRLFESGILGITIADASGGIPEANDTFLHMLGYTRNDLRAGRVRWDAIIPPEWHHTHAAAGGQLKALGRTGPWEKEYLRKDGSRVPVLVGTATLEGDRSIAFSIDLTERKKAEARKAAIVDHALDAIVGLDHQGRITEFNPAAEETFGYSRLEVLGRPMVDILIPEQMREAHRASIGRLLATKDASMLGGRFELRAMRRNGDEIAVEVTVTRVDADTPPSYIAFIRDLSELRKADSAKAALEDQLRQAQKMEAIGSLAGGVAHDFNNLLSVILSYSSMLSDDLALGDPARADIREIHAAGVRAADLTRQLLAFSRRQVLQPTVLDLNQVVVGMKRMLRRLVPANVAVTYDLASTGSMIKIDPSQAEQVIMNLAVNARDAMPHGGTLTFQTTTTRLDAGYAHAHPSVTPGDYAVLEVTDTGVGMDRATLSRIFEPFFTTKGPGKGTGLGLSTVFGIVEQSCGHVVVDSELGKGTRFQIYIPRALDGAVAAARRSLGPAPNLDRRDATILLVDDDDQVRAVVGSILRRSGYVVIEAMSSGDALLACEQHETNIDLLVSDIVLPRISGPQLAARLVAMRPEMKVLFMSGYADDTIFRHGVLDSEVEYLPKPITPETLTRKVSEVLWSGGDDREVPPGENREELISTVLRVAPLAPLARGGRE